MVDVTNIVAQVVVAPKRLKPNPADGSNQALPVPAFSPQAASTGKKYRLKCFESKTDDRIRTAKEAMALAVVIAVVARISPTPEMVPTTGSLSTRMMV